jgi:hypothetical protein
MGKHHYWVVRGKTQVSEVKMRRWEERPGMIRPGRLGFRASGPAPPSPRRVLEAWDATNRPLTSNGAPGPSRFILSERRLAHEDARPCSSRPETVG